MAGEGFFLGGVAEGIESSDKRILAKRTQDQDFAIRTRGLDIQEKTLKRAEQQDFQKRGDELIADTMTNIASVIKEAKAAGKDPATIEKPITAMLDSARLIASKVGRDPNALTARVQSLLAAPTNVEAATGAGVSKGTEAATTQKTAAEILGGGSGLILDPAKRAESEDKLRDDYTKESKAFSVVRDYRGNMDALPKDFTKWTGAEDIVAVFAFMKMQDPNSAVMPTEQANAANAGGVPEAVRALYNRLIGGGTLGAGARKELVEAANGVFQNRVKNHNSVVKDFEGIAKNRGLNPKNIIIDYNPSKSITGTTPGGIKFTIEP